MPRAPKHCGHPGCLEKTAEQYCPPHKAQRQARGNTTSRGYGWQHQQARADMVGQAVGTTCPLCNEPIEAGQAVELDHSTPLAVDSTSIGDRIVHARCNSSAGGKLGAR